MSLFVKALLLLLLLRPFALGQQPRVSDAPPSFNHGKYVGSLELRPLSDGRTMQVEKPFTYTDWQGHTLTAEAGFVSDGASIPRAFWSIVGGPWDGLYRNAAVIHDVGCVSHKYTWQDTHRLFFEAMLDSGVDVPTAKTLYWGVLVGGPRWRVISVTSAKSSAALDAEVASQLAKLSQVQKDTTTVKISKMESERTEATYSADISVPVGAERIVTAEELKKLRSELQRREANGKSVPVEQIERMAERGTTDPSIQ